MPTATWDRLNSSRRNAVLAAAEDEFAENGFSRGSLNVIARNAGVAKGSLFQYFEDKADLFGHIVDRASARIGAAMDAVDAELDWDAAFFPAFTSMLSAWAGHFDQHPRDRALTVWASLELDNETRRVVTDEVVRRHLDFIGPHLYAARAQRWLRPDADLDAFMSLLLLLLPHLAMEPSMRHVDPLFAGEQSDSDRDSIRRLVAVFRAAFGTTTSITESSGRPQRNASVKTRTTSVERSQLR